MEGDLAQAIAHVADEERQQHAALFERKAMHTRHQAEPLRREFLGERREFRILHGAANQVRGGDGPRFHGGEMQHARPLGVVLPGTPSREEVQPQAEARLQNAPLRPPGPGLRQAAAAQEHMAGLFEPTRAGAIDVVETGAARRVVRQPLNRLGH